MVATNANIEGILISEKRAWSGKTNKYNLSKYAADGPEGHVVMHLQGYLVLYSGGWVGGHGI